MSGGKWKAGDFIARYCLLLKSTQYVLAVSPFVYLNTVFYPDIVECAA